MINKNCGAKVRHTALSRCDKNLLGKRKPCSISTQRTRCPMFPQSSRPALVRRREADASSMNSPWGLKKTDTAVWKRFVCAANIASLAILIQPFMPDAMNKLLDQLAVPLMNALPKLTQPTRQIRTALRHRKASSRVTSTHRRRHKNAPRILSLAWPPFVVHSDICGRRRRRNSSELRLPRNAINQVPASKHRRPTMLPV